MQKNWPACRGVSGVHLAPKISAFKCLCYFNLVTLQIGVGEDPTRRADLTDERGSNRAVVLIESGSTVCSDCGESA